ncbi:HupE/UreJ family protein [Agromyces sp. MMS24-JH15]|uniref:HupE/UreJ family protein n=1 Tax=Agromyces sp. MMS24-JH15 TaxID=3243765 RepID=UPI003748E8CA
MPAPTRSRRLRAIAATAIALALPMLGLALAPTPASAHGFTSTVYAEATSTSTGVEVELDLEYDLLVVSAAENEGDPAFFDDGMAVFETGDEPEALAAHPETVLAYVADRFTVAVGGEACTPRQRGDATVHERDGVPYATYVLDFACAGGGGAEAADAAGRHGAAALEFRSALFPDDEGYVTGTTTILDYDLDGQAGSAALDDAHPTYSTEQPWTERFAEFFLLGAEHLLGGLDHILFLVALIVGSRRLRDVILAATTFTVAHSITFLLAALGLVRVPSVVVEPVIALSIAIVAAWYLLGVARARDIRSPAPSLDAGGRRLDRSDASRLAVVFVFGLIHGLGFASALGIDEAWSWTLLGSLLVFNVGIEAVQVGIILVAFPLLALLRRRTPLAAGLAAVAVASVVTVVGLVWFVERVPWWA